jgi:hypothetical protein
MWDFHKLSVFSTNNNNNADSNLEIKETIIFEQGVLELMAHGWQFILSSKDTSCTILYSPTAYETPTLRLCK